MWEALWENEVWVQGNVAMCGTVNEGNERENFDTNALDPDGWDYVSHFIRLGLGQDESM